MDELEHHVRGFPASDGVRCALEELLLGVRLLAEAVGTVLPALELAVAGADMLRYDVGLSMRP
jgi:hypothetical protein